jgi:threonine dehydratase
VTRELNLKDKKVVAVLSGGNIDAELLFRVMKAQMDKGSNASF